MGGGLRCVALLVLGACGSTANQGRDLVRERELYTLTGFKAQMPGQLTAYVDTVADERGPLPELVEGIYKPQYVGDGIYARPVPHMVRELLLQEIEDSHLFKEIVATPDAADIVVQPALAAFYASIEERVAGRRTRAKSGLKLRVFGPKDATGARPRLFEESYESNELQRDGLGFTTSLLSDQGLTLKMAMGRMLRDLDGKRVGREASAVEASATRPAQSPAK